MNRSGFWEKIELPSTLEMRYRLGRRTARDRSVSRLCTCSFLSSLILAWMLAGLATDFVTN